MRVATGLDLGDYLHSLTLAERPAALYVADGAVLWQVVEDHFLITVCTEHEHHGAPLLVPLFPPRWRCFSVAVGDRFEARHYGPPQDTPA